MDIKDTRIDGGKAFDWGKTSSDYAKFRDIYPNEFYKKILERGICLPDQTILDIVLPRNMQQHGAKWIGTDISDKQIEQAKILSQDMNIEYLVSSAENLNFADNSFDSLPPVSAFGILNTKMLHLNFII